MPTKVTHVKYLKHNVYIGRSNGAKFHYGNPFKIGIDGTRKEVIEKFELWITGKAYTDIEPERREWITHSLIYLKGKTLGCFCWPAACHGDVLAKLADDEEGIFI